MIDLLFASYQLAPSIDRKILGILHSSSPPLFYLSRFYSVHWAPLFSPLSQPLELKVIVPHSLYRASFLGNLSWAALMTAISFPASLFFSPPLERNSQTHPYVFLPGAPGTQSTFNLNGTDPVMSIRY